MSSLRYPLDIQMEMSGRQGISPESKFTYRRELKATKLDDPGSEYRQKREEAQGLNPGDTPTFRGEEDEEGDNQRD